MRLCVSLGIICMMLSGVCGLKCFTCWSANPGSCTHVWDCAEHYDRCSTSIVAENLITKECMRSDVCNNVDSVSVRCCAGDLCNGAKHTGVFVPLLLMPIAIITLFI
ncbi:CD59 glycoprotein-like [Notothenia coriiceps]|uniref:CD59 glycoprotein-like n=1 Tax=Notothenia coriiceps TaxID=8208 RepID=A0A6I9P3D7_9TELE|nr:PREDICTED: CD59 glycoprotein-like [Notothenia coriiceps]